MIRNDTLLPELGVGLAVIGLSSGPAASALVTRLVSKRQPNKPTVYEDADGKATPKSAKGFSTALPTLIIFLSAAAGLGFSILLTVLLWHAPEITSESLLLIVGAWVSPKLSSSSCLHGGEIKKKFFWLTSFVCRVH